MTKLQSKIQNSGFRIGIVNLLFLIAFCLLFSTFLHAQATLYGKILDKEGKPIYDTKITITNLHGGKAETKTSTSSKENGDYELIIPSDTAVVIEFSHVSFGIRLKSVRLAKGQRGKADITVD